MGSSPLDRGRVYSCSLGHSSRKWRLGLQGLEIGYNAKECGREKHEAAVTVKESEDSKDDKQTKNASIICLPNSSD